MTTDQEYFEVCLKRARAGLEWLSNLQGYEYKLEYIRANLSQLDLSNDMNCVLALFTDGTYDKAKNTFGLCSIECTEMGFIIDGDYMDLEWSPFDYKVDRAYAMLTRAWKELLNPERYIVTPLS